MTDNQPKETTVRMIWIFALLALASALWGLPPPAAWVPVELTAALEAPHADKGQNERLAPAATMQRGQSQHRENPRDGGATLTTRATDDWILPPGRASPASAPIAVDAVLPTLILDGGHWEGVDTSAGCARR